MALDCEAILSAALDPKQCRIDILSEVLQDRAQAKKRNAEAKRQHRDDVNTAGCGNEASRKKAREGATPAQALRAIAAQPRQATLAQPLQATSDQPLQAAVVQSDTSSRRSQHSTQGKPAVENIPEEIAALYRRIAALEAVIPRGPSAQAESADFTSTWSRVPGARRREFMSVELQACARDFSNNLCVLGLCDMAY